MNAIEIEAKIASNLIALAIDTNIPVPFCQADIDEIISNSDSDAAKINTLRKIKAAIHEVLYAPPKSL